MRSRMIKVNYDTWSISMGRSRAVQDTDSKPKPASTKKTERGIVGGDGLRDGGTRDDGIRGGGR